MHNLLALVSKNEKTVIGVLSGTSIDAVDVVLLEISGAGISTKVKVIDFKSFPIKSRLRDYIIKCSSARTLLSP